MHSVSIHEQDRLAALERYAILDTPAEEGFDALVQLASAVCGTPIALISLVDASRQWFKARVGLEVAETPRAISFCTHAIEQRTLFAVTDARSDPRFAENPLVTGEPHLRFYAGAPLATADGFRLGTICVLDRRPRLLTALQRQVLVALARQVVLQLELRRQIADMAIRQERQRSGERSLFELYAHELRTPLTSIRGSLGLLASGVLGELPPDARQVVTVAERNSERLVSLINGILDGVVILPAAGAPR